MMHVECHSAQILQKWSAQRGNVLNGLVRVEFSLRVDDDAIQEMHSQLVEQVSLKTNPDFSDQRKIRRLTRRACEQVVRYFEGDGERENVFSDLPGSGFSGLSPEDEADLEAELRIIEEEFETA